ncbi:MAG: hypothetical protein AABX69_03620, partial [Nanoarchaeota archaeon]
KMGNLPTKEINLEGKVRSVVGTLKALPDGLSRLQTSYYTSYTRVKPLMYRPGLIAYATGAILLLTAQNC